MSPFKQLRSPILKMSAERILSPHVAKLWGWRSCIMDYMACALELYMS